MLLVIQHTYLNSKFKALICQSNIINIQYTITIMNTRSFRTKISHYLKDRNQPGSRRFKLRSCKILKVEQT